MFIAYLCSRKSKITVRRLAFTLFPILGEKVASTVISVKMLLGQASGQ